MKSYACARSTMPVTVTAREIQVIVCSWVGVFRGFDLLAWGQVAIRLAAWGGSLAAGGTFKGLDDSANPLKYMPATDDKATGWSMRPCGRTGGRPKSALLQHHLDMWNIVSGNESKSWNNQPIE